MQQVITQEELIFKIALSLVPKVGNKTATDLIRHFGSAKAVFDNNSLKELCLFPQIGKVSAQKILDKSTLERAKKEWDFTQKFNISVISQEMSEYPKRLKNCSDAPFLLFFKGNAKLNAAKVVAIVGTRQPSLQGKAFCEKLIHDLAPYNPLFVSGLAYGIDVTAHEQCLQYQLPNIGVVAHGLDRIYPHVHKKIAEKMVHCGGILTEFITETNPFPKHFPMRNRIIAGMADAVVIVETANRGGSMITAYIANEYNKDVFAVPGRLNDPLSQGCNHLIKSHRASLLESAEDIAYILRWEKQKKGIQKQLFPEVTADEQVVLDILVGEDAVHLDLIIQKTKMSTSRLAVILLELELRGIIGAVPGKSFRLI